MQTSRLLFKNLTPTLPTIQVSHSVTSLLQLTHAVVLPVLHCVKLVDLPFKYKKIIKTFAVISQVIFSPLAFT